MANITEYLQKILSARYGKDVRQAIHDGIDQCYKDATDGKPGADGKSAYDYAKDGGYTGTVAEFAAKLAQENPTIEEFNQLSNEAKEDIADLYQTKAGAIIEKASGESHLCIRDTADNLVRNLKLYGNTEQNGTSGAQLLDARVLDVYNASGITCNLLGDGGIYISGTKASGDYQPCISKIIATPEVGTYVLSHSGKHTRLARIRVENNDGTYADYGNNEPFAIYANTKAVRFMVQVDPNQTVNETIYPMLNAGSTALPWEPYTNGPSPNPDYPQEIRSVKGKNLAKSVSVETTTGQYAPALYLDADLKPSTTYTLSFGGTVGNGYYTNEVLSKTSVYFVVVDGITKCTFTTKDTIASTAHVDGKGWLLLKNSKANSANVFEDVQIEKGMFATPYVPYGCLRIKAHGEQFFDKTKRTDGYVMNYNNGVLTANANYFYSDYIKVSAGKYIVSGVSDQHLHMCLYDLEKKFESGQASGRVIDVPHDGYIVFSAKIAEADAIMCNAGSEALPYEPYTENSITLSQPIELNGIGERDKVTADGIGFRYVKKIFDGTENWTQFGTFKGAFQLSVVSDYVSTGYDEVPDLKCTRFIPLSRRDVFDNAKTAITQSNALIVARDNDCAAVGDFKTKLAEWYAAGEPMEVIYKVATPITEPLPTADQIALRSLLSYDGTTHIETDSEVTQTIEAECVLDTKRYIDRKFAELATALV